MESILQYLSDSDSDEGLFDNGTLADAYLSVDVVAHNRTSGSPTIANSAGVVAKEAANVQSPFPMSPREVASVSENFENTSPALIASPPPTQHDQDVNGEGERDGATDFNASDFDCPGVDMQRMSVSSENIEGGGGGLCPSVCITSPMARHEEPRSPRASSQPFLEPTNRILSTPSVPVPPSMAFEGEGGGGGSNSRSRSNATNYSREYALMKKVCASSITTADTVSYTAYWPSPVFIYIKTAGKNFHIETHNV